MNIGAISRFVLRHKLLILGALIVPAASINVGYPSADSLAQPGEARQVLAALKQSGIGTGVLTPFEVLVDGADPGEVADTLDQVDGLRGAAAPEGANWRRGETTPVAALPETEVNTAASGDILDRTRDAAQALPGRVQVGGTAAFNMDFIDAVYSSFPLMVGLVVVVTFLLLVRAFRSLLLPLKAVILNILSVGAAYGVLVLIWQMGYGSELIWGIEPSDAITNWLPIMVFAFVFGLSMDYEVFILTRMREEYDRTGSTDQAVIRGMSNTGRLVTTAALILFLAFVAMAATPDTNAKIMATGLGAGIILDATIIRALLVPATVSLMGRWNWWLPSWLECFVPRPEPAARLGQVSFADRAD